ncbi:Protein HAPLESS 2-A [Melipona quadrifasciata]|uniref:Protein HAPLESS 2-A n=1 Tax=Melipona quadrifasciata TaxID=166423 RepID=A0A0N0BDX1_9HYME|nr:Protein HAPLESS 2-A [Melipona quadrifasciata]
MGSKRIAQERQEDAFHANPEASEKEKVLSNERGDDTEPSRQQIEQGSNERNSIETLDGIDKKAPVNRDSYPSSQDEKSEEPVVANRENNPDEFLNNYTPSSGTQLVIPPPIGLSVIEEQNRVLAPESDDDAQPFDFVNPVSFTTEASDSTRALIVVDLFKIATGSLAEPLPGTTQSPGLIDRLGGLKKNLEKAFQRLRPGSGTLAITESTTVTLNETNTTNATSTTEGTTKITDKVFRPSIKGPPENATRTSPGGAEFHEEIDIEEATFPDETNPPITGVALPERLVDLASISRNQVAPSFKVTRGRKREKKSTTASTIEKRQSSVAPRGHETDRLRGNTRGDNYDGRECSTRADSTMKFSLEAADVNVVREKLGVVSGSFSREQRNYVQVRVDDSGIHESRRRAKARRLADSTKKKRRLRIGSREEETAKIGSENLRNGETPVKGSHGINHPWFVTTETSEYTVDEQMDKYDRVFPSESSSPGRTLARGKKTRSEYEDEDVSERRKRLKSIRDKDREESKKRGDALKRKKTKTKTKKKKKKKKKNGDKERSAITSQDSPSEDYDYFLAGEQTSEEDGGNGLEGSVDGNYDYSNPALASLSEEETNDGSRISEDAAADDNSHDRSISSDSLIDEFDGYRGDLRSENQVSDRSGDPVDLGEGEDGKDLEISLTGKIHLESDSYGRPMSISFNAEPEYFRKDFIDDGKANSHGNRFPLESADSSIDASDTLVSDAGTDNANFLPDVFDVEPSGANAPLDQVNDRSVAREYFPDTIRAGNRNAGRYRNELDPRQKLLRLQKKSVETSEKPAAKKDSKQSSRVNNDWKKSLRRSKKDSESSNLVDQREQLPESLNAQGQNRNDLTKTSDELSDNSSLASLDLSNLPESNFESKEAVKALASLEREGCLAMNSTTLRMELIGITTVTDKFQAPATTTPLLSIHDLKMGDLSNMVESGTEVEKSTTAPATTTPSVGTTTIISSLNETVVEAKISYPKPDLAIALATETTTTTAATTAMKLTDTNETVVEAKMSNARPKFGTETAVQGSPSLPPAAEGSKESIERRNMLAISEFVKKLERLVADTGNSSNATGRTLIHLKKFIIVPDNRTFWSLREFSAPESRQETGTTETVVVMGEGTRVKDSGQSSEDDEQSEYSAVRENSRGEERNLIKEIIDSIIGGDDAKREPLSKRSDKSNDHGESSRSDAQNGADALSPWSGEREFRTNLRVGKNAADLAKAQEEAAPRNSGKIVDDQFLESSLENGGETPREYSDVCARNKSSVKGKREAAVVDVARSANQKRAREGKKKDAKRSKKKRRRKRKKKTEKGKGKREKKNGKKTKSKWPFKRNLLMLSEEEQIQPSNVDYGIKWGDRDKFPAKEEGRKNTESARKLPGENGSKEEPQIRGGQDCSDRKHPPNVDPLKYLESAHCLRFSDLWFVLACTCMYSVYQLEEPVVGHKVHLQIYAKRATSSGSILWKDLTNGSIVRLGTFDKHYRNREDTVIVAYDDASSASSIEYSLNPRRDRLLVPSTLSGQRSKYSEAEGWSSEYLVVQADKINEDGNECDKAGVGFTAFAGQPDRCERVSGTCLKNQPLDYWRHDIEARESGRVGCYFLSNFARVPNEAIKYNVNGTGSREFLALEYHSLHVSVIDVELRDDYNNLLTAGSSARLTEVHTDNTAIDYTVITLLITNKGSSSSSYRARITDCPKGVPVSWLNAESSTKTISPHRDRKVALNLNGRVSLNEFSCSVVLFNRNDEPAAQRQIKVRKMDRCSCVGHCECSCLSDSRDEERCQPMSKERYQAAGFRGPPLIKRVEPPTWLADVVTIVCLVLFALLLLFLLLGFLKWMIGICVPVVSRWGLDDLLETHKMTEYLERDLKSRNVVFNRYGQPVHPDTGRKSVRICCRVAEFFLNLTFFFVYPIGMLCLSCKRPRYSSQPAHSAQSKGSLMSGKGDSSAMVRVSTYGDGIDSKMEEEDTKYVIDELKKSQESLQNYNRYKVDVYKSLSSKDAQADSVVFRGGKS